ncbi:hypothetical protein IJO12_01960 [bacterium]|nr:hypothetical protein [bacterium]
MKKILSVFALLGLFVFGINSANAFSWSNLNPAYWGHCPRCEKKKSDCECKKIKKCDPCATGQAAPCNPCEKAMPQPCNPCPVQQPCDPCDKLQQINK